MSGESGPLTGVPVSRQWIMYCTGLWKGAATSSTGSFVRTGMSTVCTRTRGA